MCNSYIITFIDCRIPIVYPQVFCHMFSVDSVDVYHLFFLSFFSLRVVEFSYHWTTQGPVHLGSSFPFDGLFKRTFWPCCRWGGLALVWKCCCLRFLLIGQNWHQIIPLVPTVFFGYGDYIHLGPKLLQSVNVTI